MKAGERVTLTVNGKPVADIVLQADASAGSQDPTFTYSSSIVLPIPRSSMNSTKSRARPSTGFERLSTVESVIERSHSRLARLCRRLLEQIRNQRITGITRPAGPCTINQIADDAGKAPAALSLLLKPSVLTVIEIELDMVLHSASLAAHYPASSGSSACSLTSVSASSREGSEPATMPLPA
jgi:antitoxin (DNA-binding transcriptional repressor) of toxin-antitoxin stability system